MIEKIVLDYLSDQLEEPIYMEKPKPAPEKYVLISKTGSSRENRIDTATFLIKSYATTLLDAAELNETVKSAMDELPWSAPEVFKAALNSDGLLSDPITKERRYQAAYYITYKEANT